MTYHMASFTFEMFTLTFSSASNSEQILIRVHKVRILIRNFAVDVVTLYHLLSLINVIEGTVTLNLNTTNFKKNEIVSLFYKNNFYKDIES